MNRARYLLDENVDSLYHTQLLHREPALTVWKVGALGAPARGTLDDEIPRWCEQNAFVVVTNNRRSMPSHLADHLASGRHIPGIFLLNPSMSIGETIEELVLIWAATDPDEYQDRITFLPVSY